MVDITIVFMGFINQLITGGHHPAPSPMVPPLTISAARHEPLAAGAPKGPKGPKPGRWSRASASCAAVAPPHAPRAAPCSPRGAHGGRGSDHPTWGAKRWVKWGGNLT